MPGDLPPSTPRHTTPVSHIARERCHTSLAGVILVVMAATLVWSLTGGLRPPPRPSPPAISWCITRGVFSGLTR